MASAANQKSMELEGSLSSFQLADVFRFLVMGKLTGTLVLNAPSRTISLMFREGRLVGSGSPDRDLKLGQLLVFGGHLTRRHLQDTLDQQNDPRVGNRRLGRLLLEKRRIGRDTLRQCLILQVKEELWEAFSWSDGTFRFEHDTAPEQADDLLDLEVDALIEEAADRTEQWRSLAGNLGQLDEVYQIDPKLTALPEQPLSAGTWRVLSLINGRHSAQALTLMSGLGKFETLSALQQLQTDGWIEPMVRPRAERPVKPTATRKEPAASSSAEAVEPSEEAPAGGLRGLFGRRKRVAAPDNGNQPADEITGSRPIPRGLVRYLTSVGFGCAAVNHLAGQLATDGRTVQLASSWRALLVRFPRADLVRTADGWLDATRHESYARMAGGVDHGLAGCHEETMEALTAAARELMRPVVAERPTKARDWLERTMAPVFDQAEIQWASEFSPRAWLHQWTED